MPKQKFQCKRCGNDVWKWLSQIKDPTNVYCSIACSNFKPGQQQVCPTCGASFYARSSALAQGYSTFCSRRCSNPARGRSGVQNGNWKGGGFTRSDGYVAVGVVDGGFRGYRLEHDLVMEAHIGRRLLPGENVHHKNEIRDDNRLDNLELTTASKHIEEHHPMPEDPTKWAMVTCQGCAQLFRKRNSEMRKTTTHFCNRNCWTAFIVGRKPA